MGALIALFRSPPVANNDQRYAGADAQPPAINPEGVDPPRPEPAGTSVDAPAAPENQPAAPENELADPGDIEPPRPVQEIATLPNSNYKYYTREGLDSSQPRVCDADTEYFVDIIQRQFSDVQSSRRNIDSNSRRLRQLVGRDENAELPACLTIWAERVFGQQRAGQGDIRIEYTSVRGKSYVMSITLLVAVDEDAKRIGECVRDTINSCHRCVKHADEAMQSINEQHRALSELRCRTSAVVAAMKYADNMCVELEGFASEALSLLNNFDAAMSFFNSRALKNVTGLIAVISGPDRAQ